jgi:hypothetical protein
MLCLSLLRREEKAPPTNLSSISVTCGAGPYQVRSLSHGLLEGLIRPFNKLIANGKGSYNKPATRVGPAAGGRKIRVLPEAGAAAFANSGSLCVEPASDAAC